MILFALALQLQPVDTYKLPEPESPGERTEYRVELSLPERNKNTRWTWKISRTVISKSIIEFEVMEAKRTNVGTAMPMPVPRPSRMTPAWNGLAESYPSSWSQRENFGCLVLSLSMLEIPEEMIQDQEVNRTWAIDTTSLETNWKLKSLQRSLATFEIRLEAPALLDKPIKLRFQTNRTRPDGRLREATGTIDGLVKDQDSPANFKVTFLRKA